MFAWLNSYSARRRRNARSASCLLLEDRFQAAIERERMRADRSGTTLSLLSLLLDRSEHPRRDLKRMEQVLIRRLRSTDEAGVLGPGELGILLPDTPARGAWKLAGDLCQLMLEENLAPSCRVYQYPRSSPPEKQENGVAADEKEGVAVPPAQPLETLFIQRLPVWKRFIDVLGAIVGLVLLSPVLLAAAVAVKATSRGPTLFQQQRDGLGGVPFTMYKFRTMFDGAELRQAELRGQNEQDGPAFKIVRDPRVTAVGRILRQTSIDELPQLWNVLRGEMSLVGPRPLPCSESAACYGWQRRRLEVTPGLTCIWQVCGRSSVSFTEWVRMDVRYIKSRSLIKDLWLLVLTVPAVMLRRGAH